MGQHDTETSKNLRLQAIQALQTCGKICDRDLDYLRRILAGSVLSQEEADALFDVECAPVEKCEGWTTFFVETLTNHVVWELRPTGSVDAASGEWLIARADEAASVTGLALLVNVLAESPRIPLWFLAAVRARAARGWRGVSAALQEALSDTAANAA